MSKSRYLVNVAGRGREGRDVAPCPSSAVPDRMQRDGAGFVETVRASNRREAMMLVRRKYPDRLVLEKVLKLR